MRFHQSVAFLETDQLLEVCRATDQLGYAGIYISDHLFYPREMRSRYTYSPYEDGSPIWSPETDWPDSWCLISAAAAVTTNLTFTTGVYIAPARDLITVAKLAGTAAVISHDRVRLGVGVGWCKEEFDATGQDFHNRGRRLDDMIPALRALWRGGWVEYHGSHYDVPAMQMNPSPAAPIPILVGGHSEPAIRRAAALGDGWLGAGAYQPDDAWHYLDLLGEARRRAGRADQPFSIYLALGTLPDVDLYRRFEDAGVTDMVCAPWMLADMSHTRDYRSALDAKLAATEEFATNVIAKMGT
jgi:probable F420-dependent oxidoreductase